MAPLHHLSLGPQNATLGISQPRSTELLGAVSELWSREFFADEVATSTEAAPGNGIVASSFFRASERNVRQFCGRWFSQVWAWILLGFCCFATTLYWTSLGLFRSYAPESSLRMKWPLPRRPLQVMASLHHLSLGLQNATLGTIAGGGFRRFGLESCWGSAVSQPRSTALLGAVSELCSREFLADEVASSTGAAPGNGIIASSFFRASERNVRHFCGRWFSQVWAWIVLAFCCFATTHYWAPWGCFGAMLQSVFCGWHGHFHGGRSRQWHHCIIFL